MIGELKGLPEDTLSASEAINEVSLEKGMGSCVNAHTKQAMLVEYTKFTLGPHADTLSLLMRSKMTQQLARLVPRLKSELEFIVGQEFPECTGNIGF
jgi:hypothetical protein